MREILFRGKSTQGDGWVEGSYMEHYFSSRHGRVSAIFWNDDSSCQTYRTPVVPETVGQYSGLTDKNGKKIFEGDVIQFHKYRGEPDWIGVVKYEHCLYMAVGTMPLAYEKRIGEEPYFCPFEVQISGIDKATIKVIGNIHDNPDLLDEK